MQLSFKILRKKQFYSKNECNVFTLRALPFGGRVFFRYPEIFLTPFSNPFDLRFQKLFHEKTSAWDVVKSVLFLAKLK
jgi:hypothetical protein